MRGLARCYDELRAFVEEIPLVDCHDHTMACGPKYGDPIQALVTAYFLSDFQSASTVREMATLQNGDLSIEERWPTLDAIWRRTCHTGYAQVTRRVMKRFYGEETLTLDAVLRMRDKLLNLEDEATFTAILDEARIVARVANIWPNDRDVVEGRLKLAPKARLVIGVPQYHGVTRYDAVQGIASALDRHVTSLDEYIDVCATLFNIYKEKGAVAFKDQCAYSRTLAFGNPTRAEAEQVFNWFMEDPRRSASYPDQAKPLGDYLFHTFMRMARDLDLPVQIHTGHMAGIRNDITKTNAVGLTSLIELHQDTRFDLFHANWPYSGELLYLCKNYPNVTIDFCWANIIDPIYCQNLFKQALSSVPHGKVHGYGSDYCGHADRAWAHASIARDNIAIALSDMTEMEYLDLDGAKETAQAWMFDNPNRYFRLGLRPD